jgi:hypothetical protein
MTQTAVILDSFGAYLALSGEKKNKPEEIINAWAKSTGYKPDPDTALWMLRAEEEIRTGELTKQICELYGNHGSDQKR